MRDLANILAIYEGSDGDATKALYQELEALGPVGHVAVNLFRAQKSSSRAKVYRGGERGRGSYRRMAYDRKNWSLDNVCRALTQHGEGVGICWGWKEDPAQEVHRWVLYVDLPSGQVSFHAAARGDGPDYPGEWDGARDSSPGRICRFVVDLFRAPAEAAQAGAVA